MYRNIGLVLTLLFLLCTGCGTMDQTSRTIVGSQLGSLAGTVAGGVVGHSIGGYRGESIGTFVGSAAGGILGAVAASSPNRRNQNGQVVQPLPYLLIEDIYIEDKNENQTIEAGETCRLSFIILNDSQQTVYNVEPVIKGEKGTQYLKLSSPVTIRQLGPNERVSYTITVQASPKLKNGEATFSIRLRDPNGFLTEKETFTIPTRNRFR